MTQGEHTNKEEKEEEASERSFKDVLVGYCEATTVYTLVQISEPTRFKIRRLYWLALLIAGIIFFTVQTIDSTKRFLSYEAAISMKINYNDTVRFPAVTICNQNAFRATKVAELGLYHEVTALFTKGKLSHNKTHQMAYEKKLASMTLSELYIAARHNLSEFLIACTWNEGPCAPDDFDAVLTDYGMCYTFNKARPGVPIKEITRTGAQHAFRLQLNIEQYDYMAGPNEGAGVRIYMSDQVDPYPIKDNGMAIPPGAHAQVSMQIVQLNNLEKPYGKCEKDLELQYYSHYNKYSCSLNCLQQELVRQCGCRYFYMYPDKTNPETPPVCTVHQHFICGEAVLESYHNDAAQQCGCPIPCQYTSVESTISYGSTSNFDMKKMLSGNLIALKTSHIVSRENTQRVDRSLVTVDENMITALESVVARINTIHERIGERLSQCLYDLREVLHGIEERSAFHKGRALKGVQFTIEYNFIRYWSLYSERVLALVTSQFYPFAVSVERVIGELKNSTGNSDSNAVILREVKWTVIENELFNKLDLATRSLDLLAKVNNSYMTAGSLGTYKATINGTYDSTFLAPELFTPKHSQLTSYYTTLSQDVVVLMVNQLNLMISSGRDCVKNMSCNVTSTAEQARAYERLCRRYNYYIFLFNARVINNPLTLINQRIDAFTAMETTLTKEHDALQLVVTWQKDLLSNARSGFWKNIQNFTAQARIYLQDSTMKKTDLANLAASILIKESIQNTSTMLEQLLRRGQEFSDSLGKVKAAYIALFSNMVEETTTAYFYQRINRELNEVIANNSLASYYIPLFASLLRQPITETNYEELIPRMNADFAQSNILDLFYTNTTQAFTKLDEASSVAATMGHIAEDFTATLTELRTNLAEYLEGHKVGTAFFKENYLKVDVFLSDLSYSEIIQQVAYDENNLMGDIGGSAGLFVGASLITVFEIIDLICQLVILMKTKLNKSKSAAGKKGRDNEAVACMNVLNDHANPESVDKEGFLVGVWPATQPNPYWESGKQHQKNKTRL